MKYRIYLPVIILLISILYILAWRNLGKWLVVRDVPVKADTMVILMGSIADRVLHTADLYEEGLAEKIILVEESMGAYRILEERGVNIISNTRQVYNAAVSLGVPSDSIKILPGDATSTQMEAIIIREYLSDNPAIDTLLLISSASHTRRVSMIFRSAFRKAEMPVHLAISPSKYSGFNPDRWWRDRDDIQEVIMEYLKIANFLLFERRRL
jgi:uncharacterized SAM-binding protein YcdF (DUF218 family)